MPEGETISQNRIYSPALGPAEISAETSGSGYTAVAFLDRGLSDLDAFGDLSEGISRKIRSKGFHILEVIVAFKSKATSTCTISSKLVGSDLASQSRSVSVSGKSDDVARVCFHAPII